MLLVFAIKVFSCLQLMSSDSCQVIVADSIYDIRDKINVIVSNRSATDLNGYLSFEAFDTSTIRTIDDKLIAGQWFELTHDILWRKSKRDISAQTISTIKGGAELTISKHIFEGTEIDRPQRYALKRFRIVFNYFTDQGIPQVISNEFKIKRALQPSRR